METKIVKEKPLFAYYGINEEEKIELFRDDLLEAEVGSVWDCMGYNADKTKKVCVVAEVVYISYIEEEVFAVYIHCYDEFSYHDELVAVELKNSFV